LAAFEEASQVDSVSSYDTFLERFPSSDRIETVIYRRDRAALEEAKKIGTAQAFRAFIEKYPTSAWMDQAKYFLRYGYQKD
jgi:outer membrane protein assembly factor BamD (BamD/ComL family)